MFAALVLIVIGAVLLLANLDYVELASLKTLLHTWWPLFLILGGVSMLVTRWRRGR
jgi:Domain of unknown function (DUF5668)